MGDEAPFIRLIHFNASKPYLDSLDSIRLILSNITFLHCNYFTCSDFKDMIFYDKIYKTYITPTFIVCGKWQTLENFTEEIFA